MSLAPTLTKAEETRLVFLAKAGDPDAVVALLKAFQPLLDSTVRRFTAGFTNDPVMEEIHSAAKAGFATALSRFSPALGYRFATLLRMLVRQQVVDYIRQATRNRRRSTGEAKVKDVDLELLRAWYGEDGSVETDEQIRERMEAAMSELPHKFRQLLHDRFVLKKPVKDLVETYAENGKNAKYRAADVNHQIKQAVAALRAAFLAA